jgi:hypothetical protein
LPTDRIHPGIGYVIKLEPVAQIIEKLSEWIDLGHLPRPLEVCRRAGGKGNRDEPHAGSATGATVLIGRPKGKRPSGSVMCPLQDVQVFHVGRAQVIW